MRKFEGGPVGLSTLAVALGEEPDTIEDVYEPYLLQLGFIQRTPRGRVITELGRAHVGGERLRPERSSDVPELWVPGAGEPSIEAFVERLHRQIERFAKSGPAADAAVEVELRDGSVLRLESILARAGLRLRHALPARGGDRRTGGGRRPDRRRSRASG